MLPCSDPLVANLLAIIPEEERDASWWIVQRDGAPISGHCGGGVHLLGEIQLTRFISRLLAIFHLSRSIDALDRHFAIWRGWMSRFVPDGTAPRRYP